MSKIIIYWSGSGNTESIANEISSLIHADAVHVSNITVDEALAYETILLGCPAMGAETLEEDEFLPFYDEIKEHLAGHDVLLFGSYGWGDGEWMRTWEEDAKSCGINVLGTLIVNEGDIDQATLASFVELVK